jgi:transposase, IS5 family
MNIPLKKRAPKLAYQSPGQLTLPGFETPFEQHLKTDNRWVIMSKIIPWDELCSKYIKSMGVSSTGRPPINPRVVIGSLIIKHVCDLSDRDTVKNISENVYMQYFLGYTSFNPDPPFDPSMFVDFRKNLDMDTLNSMNDKLIELKTKFDGAKTGDPKTNGDKDGGGAIDSGGQSVPEDANSTAAVEAEPPANKGSVIFDATACPQDIAFPTDLNLLDSAREKSEELVDSLFGLSSLVKKPRTYRENARKDYLQTAQSKTKGAKKIRKAVGKQLRYLRRNIGHIDALLDNIGSMPLDKRQYKYMLVIRHVCQQQSEMWDNRKHSIDNRIVSIHQPHVRPIVRGKSRAKVEFGAKIHLSMVSGIAFLDKLSWDAFNEGSELGSFVESYKKRFGFYPREVLADKIYCTRANRAYLKERGIRLAAKPLGRPSAVQEHVRPGERNPIEGKFGQAKRAYGMDRIKARLKETSQSWIATIILVLNLVKLAGSIPYCLNAMISGMPCANPVTFRYLRPSLTWCRLVGFS